MKFGASLEEGGVPEWREQYLDYKAGKKLIKRCLDIKEAKQSSEGNYNTSHNAIDDSTPLLFPSTDRRTYSAGKDAKYNNHAETVTDTSIKSRLNLRRPSIFNYALSSKSGGGGGGVGISEEKEFTKWLDGQLDKVNSFYKEKEQDVFERFLFLQDQLYQMKEQKRYLSTTKRAPPKALNGNVYSKISKGTQLAFSKLDLPSLPSGTFLDKWRSNKKHLTDEMSMKSSSSDDFDINYNENRIRNGIDRYDNSDEASLDSESYDEDLTSEPSQFPVQIQEQEQESPSQRAQARKRDYSAKKRRFGVPYVHARKQLKLALLEHYRALSLLKSYRVLNRTAFRKITKKYDKTMNTKLSGPYMKKVDTEAYFMTSETLEKLISQDEELYISFFDPDTPDRKHSLEKLKNITYSMNLGDMKPPSYYYSYFVSGIFLGISIPLIAIGLYLALTKTINKDMYEGKYLFQIWAGFFFLNLMALLFGVNLGVFSKFKINYKFIFEFDMATVLDWKQYLFIPCLGMALLLILFWCSFSNFFPLTFPGRDWPWIYFGIMLGILFWPGEQMFGKARKWLLIALWRLLLSGFYPVEFRDFFLGDIFCSLTYSMGNISFFFCVYGSHWKGLLGRGGLSSCGSHRSHVMGFLSTLPSIWRFLQCARRYMDTGDWFPHLANMLKYAIGAMYYIFLSIYRIQRLEWNRVVFIVFASINSIFCSAWDIIMDWSLLQSGSKHPYLRDHLFFKNPSYYYAAMILDVLLRFQWIFYACFLQQIQQSAVTSFAIALAELFRRFIWIFFRMENEHCTNVILFRASRDSPLPYAISYKVERAIRNLIKVKYGLSDLLLPFDQEIYDNRGSRTTSFQQQSLTTTGHLDEEQGGGGGLVKLKPTESRKSSTTVRRSTLANISEVLNKAHIKDFQRQKTIASSADDSDDDSDEESVVTKGTTQRSDALPSIDEQMED